MNLNKIMLIGRAGKDPEATEAGTSKVAKFSLATGEKFTTKAGESKENTEWHNIAAWGKLAEFTEKYIKKGMLLFVEGKIVTRSWNDKDGLRRYMTEVVAHRIDVLDWNNKDKPKEVKETKEIEEPEIDNEPDYLPF